jgi:hypothetical protein
MRIFISADKWIDGQPTEEEALVILSYGDNSSDAYILLKCSKCFILAFLAVFLPELACSVWIPLDPWIRAGAILPLNDIKDATPGEYNNNFQGRDTFHKNAYAERVDYILAIN